MANDDVFTTIEKSFERKVKGIKLNFRLKQVRNYANSDEHGQYFPDCSVYAGDEHIADLYDITSFTNNNKNHKITNAFLYANSDVESSPYYLFFHDNGKWKGLHVKYKNEDDSINHSTFPNDIFHIDPIADYIGNPINCLWDTSLDSIIERFGKSNEKSIAKMIVLDLSEKARIWFSVSKHQNVKFKKRVLKVIDEWEKNTTHYKLIRANHCNFQLKKNEEDKLYMSILGSCNKTKLYRYLSNKPLEYLLKEGSHAMSSIVCMNDRSECFYADDYISLKKDNEDSSIDLSVSLNYKDFITSLSYCKPDNLTMWRLYGDDAKGVAFEYDMSEMKLSDEFYLAPVSYPDDDGIHLELDFIKYLFNENKYDGLHFVSARWYVWQRFFKPLGFKVEEEVRLLYSPKESPKNIEWVFANGVFSPISKLSLKDATCKYPLELKYIWLGTKYPDSKFNEILIKEHLKELGLDIDVKTSTIDYYRVNK